MGVVSKARKFFDKSQGSPLLASAHLFMAGVTRGLIPPLLYNPGFRVLGLPCSYDSTLHRFIRIHSSDLREVSFDPSSLWNERELDSACRELYFRYYRPQASDSYLNIGAARGEEVVWLLRDPVLRHSLRVVCVEPQPSVFECLALSLNLLRNVVCVKSVVAEQDGYVEVDSNFLASRSLQSPEVSTVPARAINAAQIATYFPEKTVDLCQINIEGAERWVVPLLLNSPLRVRRFMIGCHDFRAERGHGETFRTRRLVENCLQERGYELLGWSTGIDHVDDWIYAEARS